jgi:hypothetical protein
VRHRADPLIWTTNEVFTNRQPGRVDSGAEEET